MARRNDHSRDEIKEMVSAEIAAALVAQEAETEIEIDDLTDEEVKKALEEKNASKVESKVTQAQRDLQLVQKQATVARLEADQARTDLMIERKLEKAKLPEKFEEAIRIQFKDRVVEANVVDTSIKAL